MLLSDARATKGGDPVAEAAALDELVVLCPAGDSDEAEDLADDLGRPLGRGGRPERRARRLRRRPRLLTQPTVAHVVRSCLTT